jgi:hypothetical protein
MNTSRPWPWNRLPKSRPADWGIGMTVCITAFTRASEIVTLSDRQIQLTHFAGDNIMLKAEPIHVNWSALVAGTDVSNARPILNQIRRSLNFEKGLPPGQTMPEVSLEDMMEVCESAYQGHRQHLIGANYLSSFKLTLDEFRATGAQMFPSDIYRELFNSITECDIGCEMLISGFDHLGQPQLFAVDHPGIARPYTDIGFWAIGSGQNQALSSLFFAWKTGQRSLGEVLYDCCAAKFFAESEPSVGKSTFILIHKRNELPRYLDEDDIQKLRAVWNSFGAPRRPGNIKNVIDELKLKSIADAMPSSAQKSAGLP